MSRKSDEFDLASTKTCANCGKLMYRMSWAGYVYQLPTSKYESRDYFCSYSCFNRGKAKREKTLKKKYHNYCK